jgi:type I restriction enzyme S subunit
LGEICDIERGGSPRPIQKFITADPKGINWIKISDATASGKYIYETEQKITPEGVKRSRMVYEDDFLLSNSMSFGRPYIMKTTGCIHDGWLVLHKPKVDPDYLYYVLSSDLVFSQFDKLAAGSTVRNLNIGLARSVEIPYPPLPEQQRIVAILEDAYEGIATAKGNTEKNLRNARAIFESHLQSVFSQRGAGWLEKRLDEISTFSSGGTPSKRNASYWAGKIPWISGRDMKSTRLLDSYLHISKTAVEESATRMAPPGTLLILVRGMGLAHGAQIGELMAPSAFNQDIRGIHPTPELLPRYLLFALRDGINSSETVLSNAAHGTLKIDSNELQKVMIPFPPLKQQQRIVATIDTLVKESENLAKIYERKLAALDALRKSLLHRAFAGELTASMPSELIEAVA